MKKTSLFLFAGFLAVTAPHRPLCAAGPAREARNDRVERAIDSILARLTPEEKIGQLLQYSGRWSDTVVNRGITLEERALIRQGRVGSFLNAFGTGITRELQRIAVEESHARIPLLFGLDVIHGFRTTFPIPLAQAASWDPAAVERSTRVAAREASAAGVHWTFGPMVDIARDPRWGRIAEGAGEDPFLGAAMATAQVRGYQGRDLSDPTTILACAKHFAAYGAAEGGRDYNTAEISERTLRDVYLVPFKAAVDAGAGTLMASFNEIDGVPSSANKHLLTDILRNEWKFDGFVVSDWNSIGELLNHGIAATRAEAAQKSLEAGLDMDMASDVYRDNLPALVKNGKVSAKILDTAVRRILRIKFRLGLFDDPYRSCNPETEKSEMLTSSHIAAAREMARESIVLLKNQSDLLPLRRDTKTIAVIGPLADNRHDPLGPWKGLGEAKNVVSLLDGVRNAVGNSASVLTARGCTISGTDTAGFGEAVSAARCADVIVLAVGESMDMSGEAGSRSTLDLPGRQEDLVHVIMGTGKPVILVLMNGRPLAIPWEAEHVPAILETWFLGLQTGNAIGDVLFGAVAPSGKLPVSFPRTVGQVPIYYGHKNTGRPDTSNEHFSSRYIDLPSSPLYPFGYGLSYTTFSYSDLTLERQSLGTADTLRANMTLTNTGQREGDEIVQLYVRDLAGSVTRPVKELKGFQRVHLAPGASAIVPFSVPVASFAFTGLDMKKKVEPGSFILWVGPSSVGGEQTTFEVVER